MKMPDRNMIFHPAFIMLQLIPNILVIADGAALGSEIKDISEYLKVEAVKQSRNKYD
jgi:hypothetical protein